MLLLLACADPCTSATCQAEQAVAQWSGDPQSVTRRVLAIPDDHARTVVITRLEEAYPGATRALCVGLPPGNSRMRCDRLNSRPHLSVVPGDLRKGAGAVTGGLPSGRTDGELPEAGSPAIPAPSLPDVRLPVPVSEGVEASACGQERDRSACLDQGAVDAALAGEVARASATCALHAEARWADECRFNAAERVVTAQGGPGYRVAATLCGTSTRFTQECWAHILTALPRAVPGPAAPAARTALVNALARTIHDTWAPLGTDVAAEHAGRFWALYFANMYNQTTTPDGTPLGTYDAEAWPHIRAGLAMRLRVTGQQTGTLAEQAAVLEAALARRSEPVVARGTRPSLVSVPTLGLPIDAETTWFIGAARRPVSPDPELDLLFVLVASAARATPPDRALLEEATAHSAPRVAAEAARLLRALEASPG